MGIHGEDFAERPAIDRLHRGVSLVGFRIGGARLVVDQRHLAEKVAAIEDGQSFLADAGDELRDPHAAVEDDVELVAFLPFAKDHRSLAELLFGGERRQQLHLRRG